MDGNVRGPHAPVGGRSEIDGNVRGPYVAVERPEIEDNENDEVDSGVAPPLTKREKQRSSVWSSFSIFNEVDGTRSAKCNHCQKEYKNYSSRKGTSNLKRHAEICTPKSKGNGYGDNLTDETAGAQSTPVFSRRKTRFDQECNDLRIVRMMIINAFPHCMVDNNLRPALKLHSDASLKDKILYIYNEEKEKLRRSLNKSSSGGFNLTINLWGPRPTIWYCCLTLHFIDECWKMKKKVLAFKKLDLTQGYWKAVTTLTSMLEDMSIAKNVFCITAPNTQEVDTIVEEIKNWLHRDDLLPSSRTLHINCIAEILNHLAEDARATATDVYSKIKKRTSNADFTPEKESNFQRTAYTATSKSSIQAQKKALEFRETNDMNYSFNPTETGEREKATSIYKDLKQLEKALSLSRCKTTNEYFPHVCNIYRKFYQWSKSNYSGIRSMVDKMRQRFDKYLNKSIHGLAITAILDPRFKFDIVTRWFEEIYGDYATGQCQEVKKFLTEVFDEYVDGSKNSTLSSTFVSSGSANSSTSYVSDHYDMLDPLGMSSTSSYDAHNDHSNSQKSELERYLEEPKFCPIKDFDILGWWRLNKPNFPTLAKMAHDFLAIPISAAQSNPSLIVDNAKMDVTFIERDPEIIGALICAKDWLSANA